MHPEELRTWCHSSLVNVPFPSLSARVNIRRTLSGSWLSWLLYYCDNDYDQDFMIIAWSHTHSLHKVKVGTGTFCFAPFDFMDNSLVQLQAKKKTFAKKRFSFYVSFIQHCFFLSGIVWAAAQNPRAFLPQLKKNSPSTIFDFTTSTWMRGCILSYPVPEKEKKGFI